MTPEQAQNQEAQATIVGSPVAPPNKKPRNKLIPLVILLSIISIASIGFGVYSHFFKGKTAEIVECDAKYDEVETIELSEVRSLLNKFIVIENISGDANIFKDGITDRYKYYVTMSSLDYKTTKESNGDSGEPCFEYDITYEKLNDTYHEIFGSSDDVINTSEFCGLPYYSSEFGKYVSWCGCGGTTNMKYDYEILGYNLADDKLVIKVAYLEIENQEDGSYITLKDGGKEKMSTSYDLDGNYKTKRYEYLDKVPAFDLTFEKENDHYIFTDIQKL